jgi:uncharacterized protein YraI
MKLLYSVANGCMLALVCLAAHASDGYLVSNANLRAGPDTDYPIITTLRSGEEVDIQGCIDDWAWCDVIIGGDRGWVAGRLLQEEYENRRVYVSEYGSRANIPIVSFVLGSYWDQNYRNRSWYGQRTQWSNRHPSRNTQYDHRSNQNTQYDHRSNQTTQSQSNDYRDSSRQRSDHNGSNRSYEQSQPQQETVHSSPRVRTEPSTRTQQSGGWRDGQNGQQTQQSGHSGNNGNNGQQSDRGRGGNSMQQTPQPRAPQVAQPTPQPQARPAPAPAQQQPMVSDPRTRSNAAKAQKDAEKKDKDQK